MTAKTAPAVALAVLCVLPATPAGGEDIDFARPSGRMGEVEIRELLQTITDPDIRVDRTRDLIAQLGSQDFAVRVRAQRALSEMSASPFAILKEAVDSADPERSIRARSVMNKAVAEASPRVARAFGEIERNRFRGLTEAIFATAELLSENPEVVAGARGAILAGLSKEDGTFLASRVGTELEAPLREIAVLALRQVQDAGLADRFVDWSEDREFAEQVRLESALALADLGDRRALSLLADLMVEAEAGLIRSRSIVALRKLSGESFKFSFYAPEEVRIRQGKPWRRWIAGEGQSAKLDYPLGELAFENTNGHTLVSLHTLSTVVELDENRQEVWRYGCRNPRDAQRLENGNILLAEVGRDRVIEITPGGDLVWAHPVDDPNSVQMLENGNVLATSGRNERNAVEIARNGEIVWELKTEGRWFQDAVRLENGNTLLLELNRQSNYQLVEVSPQRKVVWEFTPDDFRTILKTWSGMDGIQALPDGNILISILGGITAEISKEKEVVRRFDVEDSRDAFRLENGNTLILAKERVLEVDRDGKEIWSKGGYAGMYFGSVSR